MLKITLKRILQSGWKSFIRNSWVSITAVLVMTLTLFVIINLIFFNVVTKELLAILRDKVDISVYFKQEAAEDKILKIRQNLLMLDGVKSVEYISSDKALENFKQKHESNVVLLRSLEELGGNPLPAALNVKAQSASQYEIIVNFLESLKSREIIDKINYQQNKDLISRFANFTKNMQKGGLIITLILALIAILVTFNTIRLTIYTWRNEINIMKLVGASSWYIRGPFLIEGALYGLTAGFLSLIIAYPLVYFFAPKLSIFLSGVNLLAFFNGHFWQLLIFQVLMGIALGGLSSLIAIRRHLVDL